MQINPLAIQGAFSLHPTNHHDARGNFVRLFDAALFTTHALHTDFPEHSLSTNLMAGTLRGMHFQRAPHAEIKLIRCSRGKVFDAIVDVRRDSPTYLHHVTLVLDASIPTLLYVPAGCAHGFLTLEDHSELHYMISTPYQPKAQDGLRWNDPLLSIPWPEAPSVISERDQQFPNWQR
ncbi:MAG: dTDP-4-dehydrorhamnose 3,5-epimerase family protein [Rickettsiales bacterium]|nr:dTDP-4-dehydrorhamnose 3,5-epimerase family protein [Rickettsiales bacterium]